MVPRSCLRSPRTGPIPPVARRRCRPGSPRRGHPAPAARPGPPRAAPARGRSGPFSTAARRSPDRAHTGCRHRGRYILPLCVTKSLKFGRMRFEIQSSSAVHLPSCLLDLEQREPGVDRDQQLDRRRRRAAAASAPTFRRRSDTPTAACHLPRSPTAARDCRASAPAARRRVRPVAANCRCRRRRRCFHFNSPLAASYANSPAASFPGANTITLPSTTSGDTAKPHCGTVAPGFRHQIVRPQQLARRRVEAIEISLAAERVDAAVGKRRRPARPGAGETLRGTAPRPYEPKPPCRSPRRNKRRLPLRRAAPASPRGHRPRSDSTTPAPIAAARFAFGALGVPIERQVRAAHHAVALRAAKAGHVARLQRSTVPPRRWLRIGDHATVARQEQLLRPSDSTAS